MVQSAGCIYAGLSWHAGKALSSLIQHVKFISLGRPLGLLGLSALDAAGDIYVLGETTSADFPTTGDGAYTAINGSVADGFVVKLSADLTQLLYGSFIGGSAEDRPNAIDLDSAGIAYIGGFTRSSDFPTTGSAFDRTYNGGTSDAFIA
jgi:hypothetical protein